MLHLNLKYNLNKSTYDDSDTNVEDTKDFVREFLRSQVGGGNDESEINKLDEYEIQIQLDLSDDTFYVSHNCGNRDLREGILLSYVNAD
jgi:hypothetical protein